jgi:hypothetical protein
MAGGLMGGGGKSGGSGNGDLQALMAQAFQQGSQRISQNYLDLGLGPSGANWTGQGWPSGGPFDTPPVFPSGTPFGGQITGFPAGTAFGTPSTAQTTDISNLSTQTGAAFAPNVDFQNQLNQQQQATTSQAAGLASGLGGLTNIAGGNLGTGNTGTG